MLLVMYYKTTTHEIHPVTTDNMCYRYSFRVTNIKTQCIHTFEFRTEKEANEFRDDKEKLMIILNIL